MAISNTQATARSVAASVGRTLTGRSCGVKSPGIQWHTEDGLKEEVIGFLFEVEADERSLQTSIFLFFGIVFIPSENQRDEWLEPAGQIGLA